jgi:protein-S-isoprenylcysteine O-methyltransferase Ste14
MRPLVTTAIPGQAPVEGTLMHGYAITNLAVPRSKKNARLFIPKLLFLPVILFALFSKHAYAEHGFWVTTWEVLAFFVLTVAALGRVWCSAYISGRKNHELVTDGPYSLSRNPLYFFSLFGYLGAGLAFGKLTVAFVFVVLFWLLHWPTILFEEAKLRAKFPQEYDDYAKAVPRFWPRIGPMKLPESVTFSPRTFNRAVLHCGFLMLIYMLAHMIDYFQNVGVIPVLFRHVP